MQETSSIDQILNQFPTNQKMYILMKYKSDFQEILQIQSVSSSLAKHGGALFSAVSWSIKDPIGAPGPYEPQEC